METYSVNILSASVLEEGPVSSGGECTDTHDMPRRQRKCLYLTQHSPVYHPLLVAHKLHSEKEEFVHS